MRQRLQRGLYAITDGDIAERERLLQSTEAILAAGVAALQYRDKHTAQQERLLRAEGLQALCRRYNVPFIINDDIRLAHELAADGVHIGADDPDYLSARRLLGDDAIIGVSCYNRLERALGAQQQGVDYIAFGAFFDTSSKQGTVHASPELLREARRHLKIPIVAIGGITPDNGGSLIAAGADLLAVISGIYHAATPGRAVAQYNQLFTQPR